MTDLKARFKRIERFMDLWGVPASMPFAAIVAVDAVKILWAENLFAACMTALALLGMFLSLLADTLAAWSKRLREKAMGQEQ